MSKGINQKSWLNIVIISISALILAFTLLGRFFDSGTSSTLQPELTTHVSMLQLSALDFGNIQIKKRISIWQVIPQDAIDLQQAKSIFGQWQTLLTSDLPNDIATEPNEIESASTVLLYLEGQANPIVCKVIIAKHIALVEFLASGHKIKMLPTIAMKLLPNRQIPHASKATKKS
jgi:hypothetical protein